ncbi:MAG: glycerol acyltransferase [Bacteroidetes bacterium]|nr:glycerol acyltransferase [Bacteroidota bacterium]
MELQKKFVDVEELLKSKNPKLYKSLPRFVINYIKKTIHEDEVNLFMEKHKDKFGHEFVHEIIKYIGISVEFEGTENIPTTGCVILASNHPLGGLDAVATMDIVGNIRKDFKFLVNDVLMALKNLAPVFIPVNKYAKNSPDKLEEIERTIFSSNELLLICPAGLVSRRQQNKIIQDLDWKKTFITWSRKHKKDVIPVYVHAHNSSFFYNLAYWRKKMGIKANIEQFYLPDELFKQRGKKIKITFGKPIPFQIFDESKTEQEWATLVKKHVYALHTNNTNELINNIGI